jgi:hypothetical protein
MMWDQIGLSLICEGVYKGLCVMDWVGRQHKQYYF